MDQTILLVVLVVAIVAIMGFIVFVVTRKSHAKHPGRIGRYRIVRELPSGGMSRIFLGKRSDDRSVIMKIPVESKPREDALKKFLEEGAILSKLKHPHIVGVEEYGKTAIGGLQTGFVALEYVEGHSLDKMIKGGRKFSPQEASLIISSVADALSAAHNAGIYHRDISTNNIIVNYEGNKVKSVKLIDFGIAKWQSGTEHTMKDMMKEHYASPEQIAREELDGRSDIYSLGIVYYELITGRKPFETWERKVLPRSPAELGLKLPERIDSLIMRMLDPEKTGRVGSAAEVIRENGVAPLGGETYIAASRTGPTRAEKTGRPVFLSFNRKILAGIGITAAVVIVVSVVILQENARSTGTLPHIPAAAATGPSQAGMESGLKDTVMPTEPADTPGIQKVSVSEQLNSPESAHVRYVLRCPKCGKIYYDNKYKYCIIDGTPLQRVAIPVKEPAQQVASAEQGHMVKVCPKCGAVYHDLNYKYCIKDGTPLVTRYEK